MDPLSRAYSALADPTRRAIIEQLSSGDASFTDLAKPFEISRPAVVKHLRALEAAGLIAKDGSKSRPVYRLSASAMRAPHDWLRNYARFWEGSLDRLDAYVREVVDSKGGKA